MKPSSNPSTVSPVVNPIEIKSAPKTAPKEFVVDGVVYSSAGQYAFALAQARNAKDKV